MNIVLLFFLVKSFLVVVPIVEATECGVVPIVQWGLTPSRRVEDLPRPVNLVVVTHTVTRECSTDEECVGIVRAIRNTHTGNGMRDISLSLKGVAAGTHRYINEATNLALKSSKALVIDFEPIDRFVVGGNGKIYEGAGWKVGAHTLNYNNRSISLSFIGEFSSKLPTPKALEAAKNFLGCFLNTRYLGCEYSLVGHRQLTSTLSPGDELHRYIQTWPHWTNNPTKA